MSTEIATNNSTNSSPDTGSQIASKILAALNNGSAQADLNTTSSTQSDSQGSSQATWHIATGQDSYDVSVAWTPNESDDPRFTLHSVNITTEAGANYQFTVNDREKTVPEEIRNLAKELIFTQLQEDSTNHPQAVNQLHRSPISNKNTVPLQELSESIKNLQQALNGNSTVNIAQLDYSPVFRTLKTIADNFNNYIEKLNNVISEQGNLIQGLRVEDSANSLTLESKQAAYTRLLDEVNKYTKELKNLEGALERVRAKASNYNHRFDKTTLDEKDANLAAQNQTTLAEGVDDKLRRVQEEIQKLFSEIEERKDEIANNFKKPHDTAAGELKESVNNMKTAMANRRQSSSALGRFSRNLTNMVVGALPTTENGALAVATVTVLGIGIGLGAGTATLEYLLDQLATLFGR